LYFASNRPLHDSISKSKDYDIWYVERKNQKSKWSKPINLGLPVNSEYDEFYPSVATNGNLYFTSENPKSIGKDDIYVSYWKNNQYSEPENLSKNINSIGYEFNAFVSPDEKFILFTGYGRTDGFGSGDLYISYKNKEGNWETVKNLGDSTNSKAMDYCPFYDSKNKILYFTSKRNSVTNSNFKNITDFEKEITQYENGFSRIYKLQIEF
jgi:tricorn protease-like protein